jgi:hypothetical protein
MFNWAGLFCACRRDIEFDPKFVERLRGRDPTISGERGEQPASIRNGIRIRRQLIYDARHAKGRYRPARHLAEAIRCRNRTARAPGDAADLIRRCLVAFRSGRSMRREIHGVRQSDHHETLRHLQGAFGQHRARHPHGRTSDECCREEEYDAVASVSPVANENVLEWSAVPGPALKGRTYLSCVWMSTLLLSAGYDDQGADG